MENVKLRALTITDLPLTLKWHNQLDIIEMYAGHPFPINEEMERKWYEKILTSNFPVTVFGIELIENNKLIGLTILRDINLIIDRQKRQYILVIKMKDQRDIPKKH